MKGTDRLKITYISQAPLEGSGVGGGARVKSIVNIFKRMNFKIDFISYSFYSNKFGIEHKELNQFLQTSTVHTPNNLPRFLKALTIFPVFVYAWKSCKNSDIIFADFNNIIASMPAIALGKIFHKPIILDCIDTKLFKIIPCNIYKYIAKNADALFAISHYLVESLKREYNCKNVVYVPIFVDTNCFKMDMKAREKIREKLRIKKDEAVIGYAGSFAYYEGVPILLQAFKNLTKKYQKIKLAIIGKIFWPNNDEDIPKLIKHLNLKDRVILIPSQPHEEVPKFLSTFDILCCPKIDCEINRAANPVKVVEYLSMGLPTVCSAVGGIIDTIEDGVDGFLVKPGDVKDLERKLEWVILNPERAKEIGEKGRKKAIERYSFDAIENTIKKSISEIVDTKKGDKK
jgi:glycosyltransferase involved in cell wall biosynthesis